MSVCVCVCHCSYVIVCVLRFCVKVSFCVSLCIVCDILCLCHRVCFCVCLFVRVFAFVFVYDCVILVVSTLDCSPAYTSFHVILRLKYRSLSRNIIFIVQFQTLYFCLFNILCVFVKLRKYVEKSYTSVCDCQCDCQCE